MKLAKVQHIRCGEYEAATCVWIADDMTEDQFDEYVGRARKAYLDAEKAMKEEAPPFVDHMPNYRAFPKSTVEDVEKAHAAKLAERKKWEEKTKAARSAFSDVLVSVAGGKIMSFWAEDPTIVATVDWGHQHGTVIEYGGTITSERDFNKQQSDYED